MATLLGKEHLEGAPNKAASECLYKYTYSFKFGGVVCWPKPVVISVTVPF